MSPRESLAESTDSPAFSRGNLHRESPDRKATPFFNALLAAERAAPLVAAIHAYVAVHTHPPQRLDSLVPDYLGSLPEGLPPLQLVTGELAQRIYHNPWVLEAEVPIGLLNWDLWLYFPDGDYPRSGYGGWIERIGDWGYVHE